MDPAVGHADTNPRLTADSRKAAAGSFDSKTLQLSV